MKSARRADFLFVGLAVLPAAWVFGGLFDLALLFFVPLLIVACLAGLWEQIETSGTEQASGEPGEQRSGAGPPEIGLNLRSQHAGPANKSGAGE
jgi:hypothetical protein